MTNQTFSLYERLNEQALTALTNEAEKYPCTFSTILDELKTKCFFGHLTLGTVLSMASCSTLREIVGVEYYTDFPFISVMEKLLTSSDPYVKGS